MNYRIIKLDNVEEDGSVTCGDLLKIFCEQQGWLDLGFCYLLNGEVRCSICHDILGYLWDLPERFQKLLKGER